MTNLDLRQARIYFFILLKCIITYLRALSLVLCAKQGQKYRCSESANKKFYLRMEN